MWRVSAEFMGVSLTQSVVNSFDPLLLFITSPFTQLRRVVRRMAHRKGSKFRCPGIKPQRYHLSAMRLWPVIYPGASQLVAILCSLPQDI